MIKDNIIITLTSWHKRINNVKIVLESIHKQTKLPDKIILNLCTEDFPNMENDLPEDLLSYINEHGDIEVYWYIENYKAWKKHLHALDIANDNDIIISIDDDHIYEPHFIENMYVSFCYYNKEFAVTYYKSELFHHLWSFWGGGTLYKKAFWGNYKKYLTYDILHNAYEDIFITTLFAINNVMILPEMFYLEKEKDMIFDHTNSFSAIDDTNREYVLNMMASTLKAMEDSLDRFYFPKDFKHVYTPHFWQILKDLVQNKQEYVKKYPVVKYTIDAFNDNFLSADIMPVSDDDLNNLNLNIHRLSKEELIGKDNKLIVTISSWTKRIHNVVPVLQGILNNTIQPDEIVINLAKSDFNISDNDDIKDYNNLFKFNHPELVDILNLIEEHKNIYIHWYDDATIKSWKKHLYVIEHYSPNDVIICIDDDILYTEIYLETMLKTYKYFNCEFPISICECIIQGQFGMNGMSTLYRPKDFNNFKSYMNSKIIHSFPEDNHLLNILSANNVSLLPVAGINYLFKDKNFNEGESNFGNGNFDDNWWKSYRNIMDESYKILSEQCKDHPAYNYGWKPFCYNLALYTMKTYLDKYKNIHTNGYAKYIYDTLNDYFNNQFGQCCCYYDILDTYGNTIL